MREVSVKLIQKEISRLCIEANKVLPESLENCIKNSVKTETTELGRNVLCDLCENMDAARELDMPICQDTGMAVVFLEIGQDVHLVDGSLYDAVNDGVRDGYINGFLRLSVVADPLKRINTQSNTPAIIHTEITDGEKIKITVAPKGFGSENMSAVKMLNPSDGVEDIIDFVAGCVLKAGSNPCPPVVIGIGIGGDFEYSAILAKKALCRDIDIRNSDPLYAELEEKILNRINELDIGPQGFGGNTTALAVNIEQFATHIAGLPVAVNVGCHVTRHAKAII